MSAESLVASVIANAQAQANAATTQGTAFATIAAQLVHVLSIPALPSPDRPNVYIPPFDPSSDTLNLSQHLLDGYDDAMADFDPDFIAEITDFINRYFPRFTACLKTVVDDWLCDTITGSTSTYGETGLPIAVEAALWNRGRDREVIDARRVVDEAISGFAARGWSLPSGALSDIVYHAQQAASDKASTINREVMIKAAEIKIENVKFAITEANRLRLGIIAALVSFLRAWTDMRQLALEKAKAIVESRVRLYSAIGEYYRAIIAAAQLYLEYDKIRIDPKVRELEAFMASSVATFEARVKGAVSAAEVMAEIASAALGAQNTLAEIAHQTSVSAES